MAYSEPALRAKDDTPTAAILNVYANNPPALVAAAYNFQVMASSGEIATAKSHYATFTHRGRWLVYATEPAEAENKATAVLFPYVRNEAVGEEVTLPDAPDGAAFDLDNNVGWMIPGRVYQVDNTIYCFELPEFG